MSSKRSTYHRSMRYGICLPNFTDLASAEAIEGAAEVAEPIGGDTVEFGNLGMSGRCHVRGAYLDETLALWRHLWSGSTEPFHGRFHEFEDFVFGPLPAQGASLPIVIGGRAEAALARAGRLG